MVEQSERKRLQIDGEFLRVRIDLPSFQLDMMTREPQGALPELRKIIEALHADEDIMYEEFVLQELRDQFSEAFATNTQIMDIVRKLLKQEEDYRISKTSLVATDTIDVSENTRKSTIDRKNVQRAIVQLTSSVDRKAVRHGIVHLNGKLEREEKVLILDNIHKHMPTAQLRAFHSGADEEKIRIECIFFGEFPDRDEE